MTALYQLSQQYAELQALADTDDEAMSLAIVDTLEGVGGEIQSKAEAIAIIALNMGSDVAAIDAEIDRLSARKRAITNRQNDLKDYLRENMERTGITKISCPLFSITCAKGREVVVIENETKIPDEYMRVKTDIAPDKTALAKALKEGVEIPGVALERGKSSIRIK